MGQNGGWFQGIDLVVFCFASEKCFLQRHLGRSPSTCIPWQLGGKQLGTHARGSNGLCPVTPYMALTCFHHHGVLGNRTPYGRPCKASNLAVQRQGPGSHSGAATMTAPPEMPAPKASESKVCQVWQLPFKTPNVEEQETGHLPCVSGGDGRFPKLMKNHCQFENMNCKKTVSPCWQAVRPP